MKKSLINLGLCAAGVLAIAALAPGYASAATPGTAANAKIVNVVTVTYYDATGTNSHQASTSTSVQVLLKQAALTVATAVAFPTVDSGTTTTSFVALTANANGSDSYKVTPTNSPALLAAGNAIGYSVESDTVGGTSAAFTGTVNLGATSIVSVASAGGGTQVISIPGGALNGISAGSIVVIGTNSYRVTAATAGQQAAYSNVGSSLTLGSFTQAEVLGTITLAIDPNGSNVAPALATTGLAGTIVGERKYLKITDNASVVSNTTNGTDSFSIATDTTTGSNPTGPLTDLATFYFVSVSINKAVVNVTNPAAGFFGKPGDVLEYTVSVTNSSSGNAGKVTITDAVPAYTTLVSGAGVYGSGGGTGVAGEKFATISDGINLVNVTLDESDSETQPGGAVLTGFGNTTGHAIVAGTPINFFLGTSSDKATGGTVASSKTYTIKYQVKIN